MMTRPRQRRHSNVLLGATAFALLSLGMAILLPPVNYWLRWWPEVDPALHAGAFLLTYLAVSLMLPVFLPRKAKTPERPPLLKLKAGTWWYRVMLTAGARPARRVL